MLQVKTLRTFALNAKDLAQAERFYTQILGGEVVRRIDPNDEQLKRGRVKEVDLQLGNVQVHLFDASQAPRSGVPHHTMMMPWREKAEALKELERGGTKVENVRDHGDGKSYSLYVKDPDGNLWELWAAAS
ncbi:MAG TPA: VOC family protein [Verrucomicrobiae bacterium]|jgi:catechol-2,3-dioxygenase|nr:VOC family protein [Verrucomicrobiae bacterium]